MGLLNTNCKKNMYLDPSSMPMFLISPLAQPHCRFCICSTVTRFHRLFVCFGNVFFQGGFAPFPFFTSHVIPFLFSFPAQKTRLPVQTWRHFSGFTSSRIWLRKLAPPRRPTTSAYNYKQLYETVVANTFAQTALCSLEVNHKLPPINCYYMLLH